MARENLIGISCRISKELHRRVNEVAVRRGCEKGVIHREALELYVLLLENQKLLASYRNSEEWEKGGRGVVDGVQDGDGVNEEG